MDKLQQSQILLSSKDRKINEIEPTGLEFSTQKKISERSNIKSMETDDSGAKDTPTSLQVENQDVRGLQSVLLFFKLLKRRVSVGTDETSKGRYKFHKKYLSKIKVIFLIIYIVIDPIIDTPQWCLNQFKQQEDFNRWQINLHCEVFDVPYSRNPTWNPLIITILDMTCLAFFLFFKCYKNSWRTKKNNFLEKRDVILAIAVFLIFIDYSICFALFHKPYWSLFLRPVVFACFLHQIRLNARQLYGDLKDTFVTIFAIFFFITWFAGIGIYLFRYSLEGYTMFDGLYSAHFNLIVLITTANFPDIMLPAYQENYWSMLYFVAFLCIGLFFMMNFLLANVYQHFKDRLERDVLTIIMQTESYLEEYFDNFDYHSKGFLNAQETQEFFASLFNLNLNRKKHFDIFTELIKTMGCHEAQILKKECVMDFFLLEEGFLKYQQIKYNIKCSLVCQTVQSELNSSLRKQASDVIKDSLLSASDPTVQNQQNFSEQQEYLVVKNQDSLLSNDDGVAIAQINSNQQNRDIPLLENHELQVDNECQMSPWRTRMTKLLINPIYVGSLAAINLFFSVFLSMYFVEYKVSSNLHDNKLLECVILIANYIFFFDMIANFIVLRPKNVWNEKKFLYLELIFQSFQIIMLVYTLLSHEPFHFEELIFFEIPLYFMVRNIRVFSYLAELENMKTMLETSKYITKPILGKFLFIYLIFYIYAQIGEVWFGGKVTIQSFTEQCQSCTPLYYLLNFNDYCSAMITLFQQLIINNWFVTVDMYTNIMPGWQAILIHIYFISFWIIIVLIQMNIVIAIMLEIQGQVTEQVRQKFMKRSVHAQLRDFFRGDDLQEIKQKLSEAREILEQEEVRLESQLLTEGNRAESKQSLSQLLRQTRATSKASLSRGASMVNNHQSVRRFNNIVQNRISMNPDATRQIILQ